MDFPNTLAGQLEKAGLELSDRKDALERATAKLSSGDSAKYPTIFNAWIKAKERWDNALMACIEAGETQSHKLLG